MNQLHVAAIRYAERGWPVFPLHGMRGGRCTCGRADCSSAGKHPLTKRGLKDAAVERTQINAWWRRWPKANIGLVTGESSGIVVVDIDLPRAFESLDRLIGRLPKTLISVTGGGGLHLIYRRAAELRCTSARLPGLSGHLPGIDLRADGGYIVAPPSLHGSGERYSWLEAATEISSAPTWLRQPPPREIRIPEATAFTGDGTPYGLAALEGLLTDMRTAPEGERNHTLYRTARRINDLVATGHLAASALDQLAQAAASSGLGTHEITRTMNSATGRGSVSLRP